jgi:hypothetical protein
MALFKSFYYSSCEMQASSKKIKVKQGYSSTLFFFFNIGARRGGWLVNATPWQLYPWKRDLVLMVGFASCRFRLDGCGKSCL